MCDNESGGVDATDKDSGGSDKIDVDDVERIKPYLFILYFR